MVWSRSYHSYQSYVTPVEDELVELVNECFNPYREDLDTNELDIMSVDENGKLHSTTGRVEDTKANSSGGGSTSGSQGSGGRTEPSGTPSATPEPLPTESAAPSTMPEPTPSESGTQPPAESGTPAPSEVPEQPSVPPSAPPAETPTPTPEPTPAATPTPEIPAPESGGEVVLPPEAVA